MDTGSPQDEQNLLQTAKQAAIAVRNIPINQRDHAIQTLSIMFQDHINDVLEANTLDLETSRDLAVPSILINWLKLNPARLRYIARIVDQLTDPHCINSDVQSTPYGNRLVHSSPVGVVALIYESLPELALLMAAMCIKTGNSLVLVGGNETSHTNQAIANIIQAALEQSDYPTDSIVLLPSSRRNTLETLLKAESGIDLAIPYGRPALVQQVSQLSQVPTIQSAIGNCYLFWSHTGSVEKVQKIIIQSHQGHPEANNAIDKVLIPTNLQRPLLNLLWDNLEEAGFEIQADQELCSDFPDLKPADPSIWGQPSLRKMVAFKLVSSLPNAIQWTNTYSSGHADCIVSDSIKEIQTFCNAVKSATIFTNRPPEFTRLKGQFNHSISFGMAKPGGFVDGVIGLESLMKSKAIFQGFN